MPVEHMKTTVAINDRGDRRAIPQTPCPDVQPAPKGTPTPTRNPPMMVNFDEV